MKYVLGLSLVCLFAAVLPAQSGQQVNFLFHHKAGNVPLVLGETVFPIWNGKKIILTRAEFYLSEIALLKPDSSTVALKDVYFLVNANAPAKVYEAGQWDVPAIIGLNLHTGVDSAHNHLDPSSYPSEHPLANQDPSMHWGWAAGYRFMAIEGFVDNNGDGIPESVFQYHNLGDALYTAVHLAGAQQAQNGALNLNIEVNYAQLFQNIPLSGNLIEHGSDTNNATMMANTGKKGFLQLVQATAAPALPEDTPEVAAWPNPAAAQTTLRYTLPEGAPLTLVLTNSLGQSVYTQSGLPASGAVDIRTASLPNGAYQCAFYRNGQGLAQYRLLVQR